MCFTIAMHLPRETISNRFAVDAGALKDYDFRYYYSAFSNPLVPVISQAEPGKISLMQWGLIPAWCRDEEQAMEIRKGTYNARSESLEDKNSFKIPFRKGRCIVITGGFFEWQHNAGKKTPWFISLRNGEPMAFAGLYDTWVNPADGSILTTFSIITTQANPLMEKIHNTGKRMPLILPGEKENCWLSKETEPGELKELLLPFPEKELNAWTVSPDLIGKNNNPHNPAVIKKADHYTSGTLF